MSCNRKTESKNDLRVENNTSPIRFGLRGESLFYQLNGNEYEIWSTWIEERRVYLDDLDETDLSDEEKTQIFKEIVTFINLKEKRKPVFFYNEDLQSSTLWKKLCAQFTDKIQRVEITTTEQENENFYNYLVETLQNGNVEHNFNGLIIKSVEDLDKHWDEIKK